MKYNFSLQVSLANNKSLNIIFKITRKDLKKKYFIKYNILSRNNYLK